MMDEYAFAQIGSTLSDIASNVSAGPAPAAPSGSFSYTPEQLRDLIKEWNDLERDYRQSSRDGDILQRVEGPGSEPASESHATMASYSGSAYLRSLDQKAQYCHDQAQKLQHTLNEYLGVEERNVAEIGNAGAQDGI